MMCILCTTIKVKSTLLNSGLRESLYPIDKEQKVVGIFWQYLEYKPGLRHRHLGQQKLQQQWNFTKLGIAITNNKKPNTGPPKPKKPQTQESAQFIKFCTGQQVFKQ